ncbi:MAG: hypothetical protein LBP40_04925 [Campylobacteraceae bacterium]|jgi:hypothetical protein|nr:hypothetical protein [Campylobacteraceae bacterium]
MLIFWAAAIFGSIFFVLRVITSIVGGFGDDSMDATDDAFKLLSLNSITSFIAMFGWSGLAAYSQYQFSFFVSLAVAMICGIITMFITAFLFKQAMRLKSDGVVFDVNQAVGQSGEVYMKIPKDGSGKITFSLNGMKHEFDAVSEESCDIDSFQKVVITKVIDSHTFAVRLIRRENNV